MKSISKSESIESNRISISKKGYIKIFAMGIILLIIGFIVTSVQAFIPRPSGFSIAFDDYNLLMRKLSAVSLILQQIGILSLSVSTFVGALVDRELSVEMKKGMIIASSIAILALAFTMIIPVYY